MAEYPALPLWTDAYLADTLDLSTREHGLYLLMMMIAWRRPDCALPDDMAWLKRSLQASANGLHGHTFNAIVPKLLDRFWKLENGKWFQKRLQKERKYLRNRSETQRKAALKRWQSNDLADAKAMPAGNAPTPTPFIESLSPSLTSESESLTTESGVEGGVGGAPNGAAHPPKKSRGSRIKQDWAPKPETVGYLLGVMKCQKAMLEEEHQAFVDHFVSSSVVTAIKRDWDRAFINWVRKEMKRVREIAEREDRWAARRAN